MTEARAGAKVTNTKLLLRSPVSALGRATAVACWALDLTGRKVTRRLPKPQQEAAGGWHGRDDSAAVLRYQFSQRLARLQQEDSSFYDAAVRALELVNRKVTASRIWCDALQPDRLAALRASVIHKTINRHDELLSR